MLRETRHFLRERFGKYYNSFGKCSHFFGSASGNIAVSSGNAAISSGILRDYQPHPSGPLREVPEEACVFPEADPKDSRRIWQAIPKNTRIHPEALPKKL
jgi:hypothetical protein